MNASSLNETLALGALTGMRSMAGPSALALRHKGALRGIVPVLAIGEMIADKTSVVGDRIDPIPLAGRALMGVLVGVVVARDRGGNPLLHGLLGASAAVIGAHLAYRVRKRLPGPGLVGGLLEDSFVVGLGSLFTSRAGRGAG
jgi:uncharacterized membrane protein